MRRLFALLFSLAACASPQPPVPSAAAAAAGPDTLELIVAGTTDTHGWLRGWDYFRNAPDTTRGLTRLATIVDSIRAAAPGRVLLVDAGDNMTGTPVTSVAMRDSAGPNPIIAAMNAMRYDAAVIGNHEFNFGLGYLNRAIAEARFPMLAANVHSPDGRHRYVPATTLQRSGARVAIIGATTPGAMIWDRDKLRGRIEVRDVVPAVRSAVQSARSTGADAIVVVLHSGLHEPSSYDTVMTGVASENVAARVAREVPGIDLIVFGHTHRELADTTIGSTLVQQPRNWAGSVSVARLTLARSGNGYRVVNKRGSVIRARGRPEQAAMLAATADAHQRAVALATRAIGTTAHAWSADSARVQDTPILDFLLEVMRRTAGADLASSAAFSLNARFGPGPITLADMAELYPFENNVLRAVRISGKQLREYLEYSTRYFRSAAAGDSLIDPSVPGYNFDIVAGVDYAIDLSKPLGSRIRDLSRNGKPVIDSDTFTMALNDYRQSGGGGFSMLRGSPVVYDQQQIIRDLLVEEVRGKASLDPADYFTRNWRLLPDSIVAPAYRSMRRLPFDRPAGPRP